jgi:hypothetical protein
MFDSYEIGLIAYAAQVDEVISVHRGIDTIDKPLLWADSYTSRVITALTDDDDELRDRAFPTGSVVLKEEFDFGDTGCTGEPVQWTVMEQLPTGSAPDTLDWRWQKVTTARAVKTEDDQRCIGCHEACGIAPDGYLGTCAIP